MKDFSIEFFTPKSELKMFLGIGVSIKKVRKNIHNLCFYKIVKIDRSNIIDTKSTRTISIGPQKLTCSQRTSSKIYKMLEKR